jgi:ActR/RegA family two-component response regulator
MSDMNFLVIDDDEVFSDILTRGLTRRGYQVQQAHNAEEAIRFANQQKFAQITVDLHLGDDSGLSLIAGSYAAWKRRRRLALSAQNALLAAFPVTLVAAIILLVALGRRDMTFVYVSQHTSHKLPLGYALSAFWGGQEGSLLLWLLVLTGYASIATAVQAVKDGADNYLAKPANVEMILTALQGDASALQADAAIEHPAPLSVARLEWEHIQRVLAEHNGNISATARALNMHRRTLQRKLAKRPVRQ